MKSNYEHETFGEVATNDMVTFEAFDNGYLSETPEALRVYLEANRFMDASYRDRYQLV